ncbi:hypothetical protein J3998_01945 [Thiomicrorhabdus sp. 6S2-11]|uniref:Hemolysin activation protein n=1 Tax=Thiomicrorhabdus marina TaxID=2818442 RepID=A0ABS3Q223_9GAMM|nr:hypothetical protein [Thiomicrorhabdus marina]MBO1926326.1 hypothetical protein [Thiomicrorhabdus marina]
MTKVPVALIFFARPDVLERTFAAIRHAKPKQLFLIQDGPREGKQTDLEKIKECRSIVENVDWDCQVYRNYSDVNLGCGGRVSSGVTWAFEHVDRLAIIEDDCVPSEGFFTFCHDLLENYKDDERIDMISGMNNLGVYDEIQNDYLFAQEGSIWGWATWKRVWDKIDFEMNEFNDPHTLKLLKEHRGQSFINDYESFKHRLHHGDKMSSWSLQRGLNMFLNSGLIIVPKKNLITNIGLAEDGANSVSSLKMIPKSMRGIYFMKTYPVEFPLNHPKYVIRDVLFEEKLKNIMGRGSKWQQFLRQSESIIYRIYYRDEKLTQKLKKLFTFGR